MLSEVQKAGYTAVNVEGQDEATEILRLTCLERNIRIEKAPAAIPALQTAGVGFAITWPEDRGDCR